MTRPRSQLISLQSTPYYHCISRCVRRAFLCGRDSYSGKNFDHRKPWLVKRLRFLSEIFAIDIAAYAVMSNHYHLVLHINKSLSQSWSDHDVIQRWCRLFKGPIAVHNYLSGSTISRAEQHKIKKLIKIWRSRLSDISWFMRCLNEYIARRANLEDDCTGRFWEGRFKSQALLDEAALLSCMAYVDLNPIRAGLADTLESSSFTSIQERIKLRVGSSKNSINARTYRSNPELMPFSECHGNNSGLPVLPYTLKSYLELVAWTGRIIKPEKNRRTHRRIPELIGALKLSPLHWQILALEIQKKSITMLNGLDRIAAAKKILSSTKAA